MNRKRPSPSTTAAACANTDNTYTSYTCTATVKGAGGTPTGNVTFAASSGEFAGTNSNQCVLAGGSCSVTYSPPTSGLGAGQITIKAVYSADQTFKVSGRGDDLWLRRRQGKQRDARIERPVRRPGGSKVKLAGKGLCPG